MPETQTTRHYEIGRLEYGAYWPSLGEEGSYYINVYYRHPSGSTGRDTLVDDLTADQALAMLDILEEAHANQEQD